MTMVDILINKLFLYYGLWYLCVFFVIFKLVYSNFYKIATKICKHLLFFVNGILPKTFKLKIVIASINKIMLVEKLYMIKIDSPSIELGFNILDSVYIYIENIYN